MINFMIGAAEMSITELDHEFSFSKQSVIALMHGATRHGFCVEHTLHDDSDLFSGGVGRSRLLQQLLSITDPGNRAIKYRGASHVPREPGSPYTDPSCPSGGIGRRSGLRPDNLSPRGEIREVKPVKLGRGPETFELMPSQAPQPAGKV